jgi:hypothetical protein
MASIRYRCSTIAAALVAMLTMACASTGPAPTDLISRVEMVIQGARSSQAETYAPLPLKLAEEKLAEAKAAMAEEDYDGARRSAEAALADAELAQSRAKSEKAIRLSEDMEKSVRSLQEEIERTP